MLWRLEFNLVKFSNASKESYVRQFPERTKVVTWELTKKFKRSLRCMSVKLVRTSLIT